MIRNLTIVAVASFVLALGCFGGAVALGGRDLIEHGWNISPDWRVDVDDDNDSVHIRAVPRSEGDRQTASRRLAWTGGDALTVDLPAEVIFTQAAPGADASVQVTGPRWLADRVVIEDGRIRLKDDGDDGSNTLKINGHGVQVLGGDDRLRVEVAAPGVRSFTLNGSGDLYLKAYDQSDLALAINGSGDVQAEGQARKVDLRISGSGEADLRDLETGDARIAVAGSGEVHAGPTGSAEVELAGSGDVYLVRKPAALSSNLAGSGEVHQDW